MNENKPSLFTRIAKKLSKAVGHPIAFSSACLAVVLWAISGPLFGFSDTWQLVINTGTTVITFLIVFLIQHTQNRDTLALQLKLDELIAATQGAPNEAIEFEDLDEKELEEKKLQLVDAAKNGNV
ncbi:MAG: low affinity iron permease family protein [Pyrinomonadaceae bacterium]